MELEFYFPKTKSKHRCVPTTGKVYPSKGGTIRYGVQATMNGSKSLPKYIKEEEFNRLGFSAETFEASVSVGEKQVHSRKGYDIDNELSGFSNMEVGDIDFEDYEDEIIESVEDEIIESIRESVDGYSEVLQDGDMDSGSVNVYTDLEITVPISGNIDYEWTANKNYDDEDDEWNAESNGKVNLTIKEMELLRAIENNYKRNKWDDEMMMGSLYHDEWNMTVYRGVMSSLAQKGIIEIGEPEKIGGKVVANWVFVNPKYIVGQEYDMEIDWNIFECKELMKEFGVEPEQIFQILDRVNPQAFSQQMDAETFSAEREKLESMNKDEVMGELYELVRPNKETYQQYLQMNKEELIKVYLDYYNDVEYDAETFESDKEYLSRKEDVAGLDDYERYQLYDDGRMTCDECGADDKTVGFVEEGYKLCGPCDREWMAKQGYEAETFESSSNNCPICKGDIHGDMSMIGEEIVPDICGKCDVYVMPQGSDFKVSCMECGFGDIYGSATPCEECESIEEKIKTVNKGAETFNAQMDGEKLMVGSRDFDDGSMMVGIGTEDIDVEDPDFMEMMIGEDGEIEYFTMPTGVNHYQRMYKPKPTHYGKMKTQNETNKSAGGDFIRIDGDGKNAETFEADPEYEGLNYHGDLPYAMMKDSYEQARKKERNPVIRDGKRVSPSERMNWEYIEVDDETIDSGYITAYFEDPNDSQTEHYLIFHFDVSDVTPHEEGLWTYSNFNFDPVNPKGYLNYTVNGERTLSTHKFTGMGAETFGAESGQMCEVCFGNDDMPYDSDHFTECRRCGKSVCIDCEGEMEHHPEWSKVCAECSNVLDNVHDYGAETFESQNSNMKLALGLTGLGIGLALWKGKELLSLWDRIKEKME